MSERFDGDMSPSSRLGRKESIGRKVLQKLFLSKGSPERGKAGPKPSNEREEGVVISVQDDSAGEDHHHDAAAPERLKRSSSQTSITSTSSNSSSRGAQAWIKLRSHTHNPELLAHLKRELNISLDHTGVASPISESIKVFQMNFNRHLHCTLGKDLNVARRFDFYAALAQTIRDYLMSTWQKTRASHRSSGGKRINYLSMEFLLGRTLGNTLINLGLQDICSRALHEMGLSLEELQEEEMDAGLGNGGLGRLAACFMDSMSTLSLPAVGYGLRYEFGIFRQKITDGYQEEIPDDWLHLGNPWETVRADHSFKVCFYGRSVFEDGHWDWAPSQAIIAQAYDTPIPGYRNGACNSLRLWSAKSCTDFDLKYFNHGDYMQAVLERNMAENITRVLYPNDNFFVGKELRLKQEYMLVSATLQDIVRRFEVQKSRSGSLSVELSDKAAIQLNDTHPSLAIPELMRLLLDEVFFTWESAWETCAKCFAYTNHTILPEALERWPMPLMQTVLPRHAQIILEINRRHLEHVAALYPGDLNKLRVCSIIEETADKHINMAHLCIVGSHAVNGVAKIHSQILKDRVFQQFYDMWPNKFQNKTNGVTPRRWLLLCNKPLADVITQRIGSGWITNLSQLRNMMTFINDDAFLDQIAAVKLQNKTSLAKWLTKTYKTAIPASAMFDMHVKRIHEYKRQMLVLLHAITMYNRLKSHSDKPFCPRVVMIGGKAAPGYHVAKMIIKLICNVAKVINNDGEVQGKLKLLFLDNYRVSLAEKIIPSADLSEQVSTAGTEASGTSNMKFMLNGALTCGTLDGANIEIKDECGAENIFIFGANVDEISRLRQGYDPWKYYNQNEELRLAINQIKDGHFSPENAQLFRPIVDSMLNPHDPYCLLADYESYVACQERISTAFADRRQWARMCVANIANAGYFSSDRTIQEYNDDIWHVKAVQVIPAETPIGMSRLNSAASFV